MNIQSWSNRSSTEFGSQPIVVQKCLTAALALITLASLNLSPQTDLFTPSIRMAFNVGQSIEAIALSPDGKWGALGTRSGRVGVFRLDSLGAPHWVTKHKKRVNALAFNRAGTLLASAGDDGDIDLVSMATGQVKELRGQKHRIFSLAFSPEGNVLASGGDAKDITLWDSTSGTELYQLERDGHKPVTFVGFNAVGTTLLSIDESGIISEWDAKNRTRLTQVRDSDKTVDSAAENFAGTYLAIGSEFTAAQKGSNLPSNAPASTREVLRTPIGRPGIGPDLSGVIRPTDLYRESRVKIYDLDRLAVAKTLDGINGQVVSISVSADNRYVAIARQRITESVLSVYDILRDSQIASFPGSGNIRAVAFSVDGQSLASAADNGDVRVYAIKGIQPTGEVGDLVGMKFSVTSSRGGSIIPANADLVIGVMGFDARDIDSGTAETVTELLQTQIAQNSRVKLVERAKVDRIIKEQNFQNSDRADASSAVQLGRLLGAGKIIFGSVGKLGTSITIHTEMVDVETDKIDGSCDVVCQRCAKEDLPEAVAKLKPALVANSH